MDDFFRLYGSEFMRDYLTRLSEYLGESDLYCLARTCTLFYNALHERIPYNVRVSEDSFQSLDVLEFLQSECVIGLHTKTHNRGYFTIPHTLKDETKCVSHAKWMMDNLYAEPGRILKFIVSHDCTEMVDPVVQFIRQTEITNDIHAYLPDVKSEKMWDILIEREFVIDFNLLQPWTNTRSIRLVVLKWEEIVQQQRSFFSNSVAINNLISAWLNLPKSNWKAYALTGASVQLQEIGILLKRVCDRMTCWERIHFAAEECECKSEARHEIEPHPRKRLKRV